MIVAYCDHDNHRIRVCGSQVDGYHFKDLKERLIANGWKWVRCNSQLPLIEYLFCKFHAEEFESK